MSFNKKERKRLEDVFKGQGFNKNIFNRPDKAGRISLTDKARTYALKKASLGNTDIIPTGLIYSKNQFKKVNPKDKKLQKILKRQTKERRFKYDQKTDSYIDRDARLKSNNVNVFIKMKRSNGQWGEEFKSPVNYSRFYNYGDNWKEDAEREIINQVIRKYGDSDVKIAKIELKDNSVLSTTQSVPINISGIRLRSASFINLDGWDKQIWDTKQGQCVFDFINDYFSNSRINKFYLEEECWNEMFDYDWKKKGISTNAIKHWCLWTNVNILALDKDENLIVKSYCLEGKHLPTLCFIVHNNHLYGLKDKLKIKSLTQKYSDRKNKFKVNARDNVEVEKKEREKYKKIIVNNHEILGTTFKYLCEYSLKYDLEIKNKNVIFNKFGLSGFICDERKEIIYFHDKRYDVVKNYYQFEPEGYKGQKLSKLVYKAIDEFKLPISKPNPLIQKLFSHKNLKDITYRGFYKEKNFTKKENLTCWDINKSHFSILQNPNEEWYILDFSSKLEIYRGDEKFKNKLYFVETDDDKLFCGNKFYPAPHVLLGLKERLITKKNIKYFIKCQTINKLTFVNLLDTYPKLLNDKNPHKDKLLKLLNNTTSGILGKTKQVKSTRKLTTSQEEMFLWFIKNDKSDYYINHCDIEEKDFYIYGDNHKTDLKTHNLPMYIQILSQQMIKMYLGIKSFTDDNWDRLVYRNIDSFVMEGEPECMSLFDYTEAGFFGQDDLPEVVFNQPLKNAEINFNEYLTKWNHTDEIKTSNDYKKLYDYVKNKKSLNIQARAGLGKSYMIEKLVQEYGEDKVLRLAFTNVASGRIGGHTIHSTLKYSFKNQTGEINKSVLKELKNKNLECICLDEQGTISSELWGLLYILKNELNVSFFCFGDFYQIGPLDNKLYNENDIVRMICDENICELQYHDKCRHSKEMYDVCELMRQGKRLECLSYFNKITKEEIVNYDIHISYTNKKKEEINALVIEEIFKKKEERKAVKTTEIIGDLSFDDFIFVGMRLMCLKNNYDKEYFNGQRYVITDLKKNQKGEIIIILTLLYLDDIEIEVSYTEYCINFEYGYCMTNHKIIGETITEDLVIHESDFIRASDRWLYTAISRGKEIKQVNIIF